MSVSEQIIPSLRVLVVEDSTIDYALLVAEFQRSNPNAELHQVDNLQGLKDTLSSGHWDAVICDHAMPGFSSHEALDLVKKANLNLPFIIYSGHLQEEQGLLAMSHGARDFVEKGKTERLISVIQRELQHGFNRRSQDPLQPSVNSPALLDQLTQLPNRHCFTLLLEERLIAHRQQDTQAIYLCLDIDRFMRINDSCGHDIGDILLNQVADRLKKFNPQAALARIGADEFGMVLECDINKTVEELGQEIANYFNQPCEINGQAFYLSFSIGAAIIPHHGSNASSLMRHAESAMISVKREGGSGVCLYTPAIHISTTRQLQLENALRSALNRGEIHVVHQPVVKAGTQQIIGSEVLARWLHPSFGLVAPEEFIAIAEETGLLVSIGNFLLEQACRDLLCWHQAGFSDLTIAVNFSASQFRREGLVDQLIAIIQSTGLDPKYVGIEITENLAMLDAPATIASLQALKSHNMKIAIDDFGMGYSALSYLKRFPVDIVKIDKSFIHNIETDPNNAAIVKTIIMLARALGLDTLAEGIETRTQADFLYQCGCDKMQGYLYGKAVSANDFLSLLIQSQHILQSKPSRRLRSLSTVALNNHRAQTKNAPQLTSF